MTAPVPFAAVLPAVSVVVATHNRAPRLATLLAALAGQDLAAPYEVLVVDDGSRDDTPAVLAAAGPGVTALRHDAPRGPAAARNAGWRAAAAPLVVFTDDDCVPPPGWLTAIVAAWDGAPDRIVQGRVTPDPREAHLEGPFSRSLWVTGVSPYFQTANIAYPRALLERADGFDEEAFGGVTAEDADLGNRCLELGAHAVYSEAALVHHAVHPLGPLGKLRVATRWAGIVPAYRRHPALRATLTYRIFWKKTHYLLARAAIGLVLPRRWRAARFWCLTPLAPAYWERAGAEGHGRRWSAPYFLVHDVVELVTIVRGAVRSRFPML